MGAVATAAPTLSVRVFLRSTTAVSCGGFNHLQPPSSREASALVSAKLPSAPFRLQEATRLQQIVYNRVTDHGFSAFGADAGNARGGPGSPQWLRSFAVVEFKLRTIAPDAHSSRYGRVCSAETMSLSQR